MMDGVLSMVAGQGTTSALMLLQSSGEYGAWATIIAILRGLVVAAGGVGFTAGLAVKAVAGGNTDRQELGNRLMGGALVGLFLGLSAEPIYRIIVELTS